MDIWDNRYNSLWMVENGNRIYCGCAGVHRVMWQGQQDERVILFGRLPQEKSLLDIPDDVTFEVHRGFYGPRNQYNEEDVIMKFNNCHVKRKWISRPVIISVNNMQVMDCHVELSCRIEVLF